METQEPQVYTPTPDSIIQMIIMLDRTKVTNIMQYETRLYIKRSYTVVLVTEFYTVKTTPGGGELAGGAGAILASIDRPGTGLSTDNPICLHDSCLLPERLVTSMCFILNLYIYFEMVYFCRGYRSVSLI